MAEVFWQTPEHTVVESVQSAYRSSAPPGRPTVRVKGSTRLIECFHKLLFLAPAADNGRPEGLAPFEGMEVFMSEQTGGSAPASVSLPDAASLEWLRKQAKHRLRELRQSNSAATLADAQFDIAKQYGFSSWRALKAH